MMIWKGMYSSMENYADNKAHSFGFHIILGTYCISYSIILLMKLCVPGFYENSTQLGAVLWFVIYCLITAFILMIVFSLKNLC